MGDSSTTLTLADWQAAAAERYGDNSSAWAFRCPVCRHAATVKDWKDAGAPEGAVAFSCVGRWIEGSKDAFSKEGVGPCTYTGGGLFRLNPITVSDEQGGKHAMFDFADRPLAPTAS